MPDVAKIVRERLSIDRIVEEIVSSTAPQGAGAIVMFLGYVKGQVDGANVEELDYEAYEPLAEEKMKQIIREEKRPGVLEIRVYHRIGNLKPGDHTIYVFASALRREEAFEVARRVLERVKHEVPIYKLERREDGEYWVLGDRRRLPRSEIVGHQRGSGEGTHP
ncbi:MAG: molybdenum cofactor biosynthesis protein MoaE [Thermoproteota archaeon]